MVLAGAVACTPEPLHRSPALAFKKSRKPCVGVNRSSKTCRQHTVSLRSCSKAPEPVAWHGNSAMLNVACASADTGLVT